MKIVCRRARRVSGESLRTPLQTVPRLPRMDRSVESSHPYKHAQSLVRGHRSKFRRLVVINEEDPEGLKHSREPYCCQLYWYGTFSPKPITAEHSFKIILYDKLLCSLAAIGSRTDDFLMRDEPAWITCTSAPF
jgi:hypothetical protein